MFCVQVEDLVKPAGESGKEHQEALSESFIGEQNNIGCRCGKELHL